MDTERTEASQEMPSKSQSNPKMIDTNAPNTLGTQGNVAGNRDFLSHTPLMRQ